MERQFVLLLHFLGFGILVTVSLAGSILNHHYRKAPDIQSKATILRTLRPIGILSPLGILIMLISGIGNMHSLSYSLLELPGWLAYKIVLFVIAAISGTIFGIKSRKRGALVGQMAAGNAPANAAELLQGYDKQISLFYLLMPLLILMILWLSVYGRLGGQ